MAKRIIDLPHHVFEKMMPVDDGCWLWTAAISAGGYGRSWDGKKSIYAHRQVYEAIVGPIAPGLQIDHLCRVRSCVNPSHLEPTTQRINILRGVSPVANNARKIYCIRGHLLSGDNLVKRSRSGRNCLTCHRDRERTRYQASRSR
jgi:hypothetical protein